VDTGLATQHRARPPCDAMPKLSDLSEADLERLYAQTTGEAVAPAPEVKESAGKRAQDGAQGGPAAKQSRGGYGKGGEAAAEGRGEGAQGKGATGSSASSSGKFELLGDNNTWFSRPAAWRQQPGQQWAPNLVFQRVAAAADKLPLALTEPGAALHVIAAALNSDVPEPMKADESKALFSETARLLFAVLGVSGEGFCPPPLRGRATMRAPQTVCWQGIAPQPLLAQWFNMPALLTVCGGDPVRASFQAGERKCKAQLVCGLSRLAALEVGQTEFKNGQKLRAPWARITEQFPEMEKTRALYAHVRRRCWEDTRDRSRSRSPKKEKKKKEEAKELNALPPHCIRFFVKKIGKLGEYQLERHFADFATVWEVSILYDKKTQKSRGMAFVTLKAEGWYEGKKIMVKDVRQWVLAEKHKCGGSELEVSEAEDKPVEDEEKKHEERVEERRQSRLERERRKTLGVTLVEEVKEEEKLVPSLWAKRWRLDLWEKLPKEFEGPAPWTSPKVVELCYSLWSEVVDHICGREASEAQEALNLFVADEETQAAGKEWSYVPAVDLLLLLGEGFVGVTSEGVFACSQGHDPMPPPPNFDKESLKAVQIPGGSSPMTTMGGMAGGMVGGMGMGMGNQIGPGNANFQGSIGSLQRGGSDREKVFVGGLTPSTTLEMLTGYFTSYGPITDAVVMMDKLTGKPRGFGFVVFEGVQQVDAVLRDYSRHRIDSKWVEVKRACPQEVMAQQAAGAAAAGGAVGGAAAAPSPGSEQFPPTPPPPAAAASQAFPPPVPPPPSPPAREAPSFGQVPPPSFASVPPPSFASLPPPSPPVPAPMGAVVPPPAPASRTFAERPSADAYDPLAD